MKDDFKKKKKFNFKLFFFFLLASAFLLFHPFLTNGDDVMDFWNSALWVASPIILFLGWVKSSASED